MDGLARVRQPEREQVAGHQLAGQPHRHVAEVDLRLRSGLVRLRDEGFHHTPPGLDPDLLTPVSDVATDHLVRDLVRTVLVEKPLEDPLHRVPLLARRIQVGPQHLVDQRLVGIQPRRPRRKLLPGLRPGRRQRLLHRQEPDTVLPLKSTARQTRLRITADRRVQIDLGLRQHPGPLVVQSTTMVPKQAPGRSQNSGSGPTSVELSRSVMSRSWMALRDSLTDLFGIMPTWTSTSPHQTVLARCGSV